MTIDWSDAERKLTGRVTVLEGTRAGAYPSGNSVLVQGSSETFLIDPSIDVIARGGAPLSPGLALMQLLRWQCAPHCSARSSSQQSNMICGSICPTD